MVKANHWSLSSSLLHYQPYHLTTMPETPPNINNNYVLTFVQIEDLLKKFKKIKIFNSEAFGIVNIFYQDDPLPKANRKKGDGRGQKIDDSSININQIIPRFATYIGEKNGTDQRFSSAFVKEKERTHTHYYIINGEQFRIRDDNGIVDVIPYLRKHVFNEKYIGILYPEQLNFVLKFKNESVANKVYNELGDKLYDLQYDPNNNSIIREPGGLHNTIIPTEFKYPHNRIIFGAPGTGKSHKANLDANELLLGERKEDKVLIIDEKKAKAAHMERVTFHPEYSYYDFVGSYKPIMRKTGKTKKIEYAFVPGPFTRILVKALRDEDNHPHLLLIEEINRARVAAVFGDMFQLLDRDKGGESEYSICLSEDMKEYLAKEGLHLEELKLPSNLYIWATMNSADQGVYPLDTAFKRRWSMEYLSIDEGAKDDNIGWNTIRQGINDLLKPHVNEDKLMGYYFLKEEERNTEAHLDEALKGKVLMYLFDDAAKPFRKRVFKEVDGKGIYSELRKEMSLGKPNLGIFAGGQFWTPHEPTQKNAQDASPAE